MDKAIFYSLLVLSLGAVWMIYHAAQREVEPAWERDYQEPYRKPLGLVIRQSETWLFVCALTLAVAIVTL